MIILSSLIKVIPTRTLQRNIQRKCIWDCNFLNLYWFFLIDILNIFLQLLLINDYNLNDSLYMHTI